MNYASAYQETYQQAVAEAGPSKALLLLAPLKLPF